MNFDDLILENVVFEVRYKHGFLYWDNFGKLWKGLASKWPDLVCMKVDPENAHIRLKEQFIDVTFGPEKSFISQHTPKDIGDFCEIVDESIDLIHSYLEINTFLRVGNRFIFVMPFDTEEEAVQAMNRTSLFSLNPDKTKHLGKTLKDIGIRLMHHDDDMGCTLNIKSVNRELPTIDLPFPGKLDTPWFHKIGMIVDVDHFTTKTVDFGILKSSELIKTNLHRVRLLMKSL
ncbi:MAG: hypothetical protein RDU59_09415 [Thermodesulfobacteriota bacterium]|nr:hypothetical protein [Thermodesulfobacteriota bacterium]